MKTNILLLIAMMVIFSGCGGGEKVSSGSCKYTDSVALAFGANSSRCYITSDESACSVRAKGSSYTFTPGGSCSN